MSLDIASNYVLYDKRGLSPLARTVHLHTFEIEVYRSGYRSLKLFTLMHQHVVEVSCPGKKATRNLSLFFCKGLEELSRKIFYVFNGELQLYKRVCLSVCWSVSSSVCWSVCQSVMLFLRWAETNRRTSYFVYTSLLFYLSISLVLSPSQKPLADLLPL